MLFNTYLVHVLGVSNNSPIHSYITWIKPYNHVMLSNLKHVITLPSYMAIINDKFSKFTSKKKEQTHMRWILNTSFSWLAWLGKHQTRYNTIPLTSFKPETVTRLNIILFDGKLMHIPYRKYICHEFDPTVIITEVEVVCPVKFMTSMQESTR